METTQELLAGQKALLRERMVSIRAQIEALRATSAPLQAQLTDAIAEQNRLDPIISTLAAQIDAIEQPTMHTLKMELADVARAEMAIPAGTTDAADAPEAE